ncbi:S41 family peptidase [Aquimarina sp. AU474]|uniref:S41 family peptidase n=1 Tax=Aquimarina sp. AU474 TaxID=2108529 RepID=UPI000D69A45D|nr:S41 family peptidase [Aquimarina sp. AU474]
MNAIKLKLLPLYLLSLLLLFSCSSDDDGPDPGPVAINNPDQDIDEFIWRGMNFWYLYKGSVNDLANDRFANDQELFQFLQQFDSPEATYDALKSTRTITVNNQVFNEDPFSFIIPDYVVWENSQQGVVTSNGMSAGFIVVPNTNNVLGYVRYVVPGSDSDTKGVTRGMYFDAIDGIKLTTATDLSASFFSPNAYTIDIVTFDGATVTGTGQTISLTKAEITENPILSSKTIDYQGEKIGYMMYNAFRDPFDGDLNDAFGQFKNDGITDLILDLRYNRGGSVRSTTVLASLITGQFTGEIFNKRNYNPEVQAIFQDQAPQVLTDIFTNVTLEGNNTPLNTLGLTRVYVLTSRLSASASELILNGLDPYIDVIQIGETTSGKYQGSITIYDTDNFSRTGPNLNPDHRYAIQPLVVKSSNANDVTDYAAGFLADVSFSEINRLFAGQDIGVIGEVDEPHLKTALDLITMGTTATTDSNKVGITDHELYWDPESELPGYQHMYYDLENSPFSRTTTKE